MKRTSPFKRLDRPRRPTSAIVHRGRVKVLEGQLSELRAELEEKKGVSEGYLDRLMRMQAEFENYRKRIEKEREDVRRMASERIVRELVDVAENLERALDACAGSAGPVPDSLGEGIRMTLNSLKDVLCREGLSEIDSVGKPFDPNYHEVVSTVASEDHPENTVVKEYMKGYLLNTRVLRPAKVEVSSGKPER